MPSGSAAAPRVFGPGEVRLDACLSRQGKRALKGTGCKAGFAIYGPYAAIPSSSEVEVSFELRAETTLSVVTDMVSGMGKEFHAGVNEQIVESGTRRMIGYRVRLDGQAEALESRVFIKPADASETTSFTINDFSLTVRPAPG